MTDDDRMLESLKFLRESSGWMVGVQTAIFGFLISLLSSGQLMLGSFYIKSAVTLFGFSIILAGLVLGAVPWVLNRQTIPKSIRQAPIIDFPLLKHISLAWVSAAQYTAFVAGVISLSMAVILHQIG